MNAIVKILELLPLLDKTDRTFLRHKLLDGSISFIFDSEYVNQCMKSMFTEGELGISPDEIDDVIKTSILQSAMNDISTIVDFRFYIEKAIKHHLEGS